MHEYDEIVAGQDQRRDENPGICAGDATSNCVPTLEDYDRVSTPIGGGWCASVCACGRACTSVRV